MSNLTDELTKLADLRERGVLTDAEFQAQKEQLLQAQATQAAPPPPATTPPPTTTPAVSTTQPSSQAIAPPAATPAPAASVENPFSSAAPAAAPPPANRDEQLVRTFIGPNADFYLLKWRNSDAQHKLYSWNWAAFLLSAFWMAYRKMFQPVLIVAGAMMLLVIAEIFAPVMVPFANILVIGIAAGVGWRGNTLYRDHVRRSLATIHAANADPQARLTAAQLQGGVSMPVALGLAAAWIVVVGGLGYYQYQRIVRALEATAPAAGSPFATGPGAYPSTGTGTASPPAAAAPAGGEWVVGQWGPVGSPACTTWIRLSPDHTISDNGGNTGTWSLLAGNGAADILVMTVTGQQPRSGPVTHGAGNTMVMGTGPGASTWQPEQC